MADAALPIASHVAEGAVAPVSRPPIFWFCMVLAFGGWARAGGIAFDLRLYYLLPLLVLWWARQGGMAVAIPLLLLMLLPDIGMDLGPGGISFGLSHAACVVAIGVALAFGRGGDLGAITSAVRRGWRWPMVAAGIWWVFAAMDRSRATTRFGDIGIAIDVLAMPSMVVFLLGVNWRRAAVPLGTGRSAVAYWALVVLAALAGLLVVSLLLQVSVRMDFVLVRLGAASAAYLVPAGCFVAALCAWIDWRRIVLVLLACGVAEQILVQTVGILGATLFGKGWGGGTPWPLFVQGACAALMGRVMRDFRDTSGETRLSALQQRAAMAVMLLALVVVVPLVNMEQILLWGHSRWLLAGLALLGGLLWRLPGAIGVPLAIVAACAAVGLSLEYGLNARDLSSDMGSLAGVILPYGLFGFLASRYTPRAETSDAVHATSQPINISALARVVQRIDNAATLRAFGALLAPALVLAQLLGVSALAWIGMSFSDDGGDRLSVMAIAALGALGAAWPLAFVWVDWINRQDRFRPLAGIYAAVLASVLAGLVGIAIGAGLPAILEDSPSWTRWTVIGMLVLAVVAVLLWLEGRSGRARTALWLLLGVGALLVGAALVGLVVLAWEEKGPAVLAPFALALTLVALLIVWWVRAIGLRLILCEEHPRELLFGALRQRNLWVRIAALLGLPSSMWTGSSLRQGATWAFLVSRPLVYTGVNLMKSTLPLPIGAVAVVAGHAFFAWGKRLASRAPWRPNEIADDQRPPVLFLRSFEDDQFDFKRPWWHLILRWFDLWSFRRNIDEAMVDEVAQYGPVVALGRPGEVETPFGALRHYSSHAEWQNIVTDTARRAQTIVLAAGESPGLQWEFDLLRREALVDRTVLLLHPDRGRAQSNQRAVSWLIGDEVLAAQLIEKAQSQPVALLQSADGPWLLTTDAPSAAAYVLAVRAHFQHASAEALASAAAAR